MLKRAAIALAVVFLLAAAAATFLPTSPNGAQCGTWVNPEWDRDEAAALVDKDSDLYDQAVAVDQFGIAGEIAGNAGGVAAAVRSCDSALSTRPSATLVLPGLAIVVPAGVVFVARGCKAPTPG